MECRLIPLRLTFLLILFLVGEGVEGAPTPDTATPKVAESSSDKEVARQTRQMFFDPNKRIFFSSLGDLIQGIPFLPFEINVPDAVSNIGNFVSGYLPFNFQRPNQNGHPRIEELLLKNSGNQLLNNNDHRLTLLGESRWPEIQKYGTYGLMNYQIPILGKDSSGQNLHFPQYPIHAPFWVYYPPPPHIMGK